MAKAKDDSGTIEDPDAQSGPLQRLAATAASTRTRPPIHLWNPPYCGEIGLRIGADGRWFYRDSPIGRPALVQLFASILRREGDHHVLVTPVEKIGIDVEDAPFVAVELTVEPGAEGPALAFRTNLDEWVTAGPEHPLRFEIGPASGLKPYLLVRDDLWALLTRALTFELVELAEPREISGSTLWGVESRQQFFVMGSEEEIGEAANGI